MHVVCILRTCNSTININLIKKYKVMNIIKNYTTNKFLLKKVNAHDK